MVTSSQIQETAAVGYSPSYHPHVRVSLYLPVVATVALGVSACGLVTDFGPDRVLGTGMPDGGTGGGDGSGGASGGAGGSVPNPDACPNNPDVAWVKTFGDASFDFISQTADDGEGGIYIGGQFEGSIDLGGGQLVSQGARDFFIARLDEHGNERWARRYGTMASDEAAPALAAHPDGLVVVGVANTPTDLGFGEHTPSGHDGYVALLDDAGNVKWEHWFDGPGEQRGWMFPAVHPVTGDVFAAVLFGDEVTVNGQTHSGEGEGDMIVVRLDRTTGTVEASHLLSTSGADRVMGLVPIAGRGLLVAGWTSGDIDLGDGPLTGIGSDPFAVLLDEDFDAIWGRRYVGTQQEGMLFASASDNAGVWVVGSLPAMSTLAYGSVPMSNPTDDVGGFMARLDMNTGLAIQQVVFPQFSNLSRIRELSNGDVVVSGAFRGTMSIGDQTFSASGDEPDALALRLSPAFVSGTSTDIEWVQMGIASEHYEAFYNLTVNEADAVFIGGMFNETLVIEGCQPHVSAGSTDAMIIKRVR